ncbi:hypothetical protein ASD22_04095 [Rhodanobacter sp. Root480]|uniref:hypothetical protein n=1 Tax=Rhodanobacter sp. Root480 TaxID=1736542 RepID=UPI0006F39C10|nr:hypothetical protein [Rhodanobacter sp. Root480]KQX99447.1 hypothetical protein ASD22_04095 [Rhodanobacter sp. Root480]
MTMTWLRTRFDARIRWLAGLSLALPLGIALAAPQQSVQRKPATPPVPKTAPSLRVAPIPPRPNLQFQQQVQQQQLRKEFQQSQLRGQLQQGVSDVARQPYANNPSAGRQFDRADDARRDRDRAQQQSLIDSYWGVPVPPPAPAPANSGG